MAFVNQVFPNPRLISDVGVKISQPTTMVGTGQAEYRIQKFQNYKKSWSWPSRAMNVVDRRAIQNFITDVAKFSLNSFLYLDPDNHTWANVTLQSTGSGNTFYLTERGAGTHPIFHYGGDTAVKLNGVPAAISFTKVNSLPAITVTGATPTDTVTISGTFYYAARYDSATFDFSMTALQSDGTARGSAAFIDTVGDIQITEVFE